MTLDEIPELIHGRTWEEMPVGFAFRTGGRTITETDLVTFIGLTGMIEPLFYDETVSRDLGYAGRLVPGAQTFCYAEGLVIQSGSIHGTGMAHMHCEIDIKAPVYVGDTISVVVEVTQQRAASTGNRGVITTRNTVYNQSGDVVMEYHPVRLTKGQS
ncbi:MAG TPA: MaoC family dehydratase N-terminal domain-containing protein [Ilumatobacter sp.]|nr:MaoC family dehydratase N-terminal domain-containing protein [Ilumatobacter sp.]